MSDTSASAAQNDDCSDTKRDKEINEQIDEIRTIAKYELKSDPDHWYADLTYARNPFLRGLILKFNEGKYSIGHFFNRIAPYIQVLWEEDSHSCLIVVPDCETFDVRNHRVNNEEMKEHFLDEKDDEWRWWFTPLRYATRELNDVKYPIRMAIKNAFREILPIIEYKIQYEHYFI